ncbi:SCAN domain-containing protein 3-like [Ornithodoros turicata]|uniref:SCAN domain-containing protein 3-like n=1 Tax=Ornithodoros turicata TaxID=34597 RepID=UPI003139CDCF
MSVKRRGYNESYIQCGFTCTVINGEQRPQCVVCNKVLSNDSMRPTKLKEHLHSVHPQHSDKEKCFFQRHENVLKKVKLDSTGAFQVAGHNVMEGSYFIALEIAKQKKPHTIGETLIKPCAFKMVEILLGKEQERKLAAVPLSNSTVQRRISDMADDIRDQVVQQIKSAAFGLFSIQLDESTDVASGFQLLVLARYVHAGSFKEEFLFCSTLESTTRASDVFEKVSSFFESRGLLWNKVCGCCTDGAPAMLGSKSGSQAAVKKRAPEVKSVHA